VFRKVPRHGHPIRTKPVAQIPLPAGKVVGERFEVADAIGADTLGARYRATDHKDQEVVVLRILPPEISEDSRVLAELRSQIRAAAELSHKNIARVIGMGKHEDLRFIASEYTDGQDLRSMMARRLQKGKRFSSQGAYNVLAHVCNGLDFAHQTMIHGLPAPGAIMVSNSGRVKLHDFGLVTSLVPQSNVVNGLEDGWCLAPEMKSDPLGAGRAADIYALGAMLHEQIVGRRPAPPPYQLTQDQGVDPGLVSLINRCLAADPATRPASAEEFRVTLGAIAKSAKSVNVSQPKNGAQPAASSANPPSRQVSMAQLIHDAAGEEEARWLLRHEGMDFGPFTISTIKKRLETGEAHFNDEVVDYQSMKQYPIKGHPELQHFAIQLERSQAVESAERSRVDKVQGARRKRTLFIAMTVCLVALVLVGAVAIFLLQSRPDDETIAPETGRRDTRKEEIQVRVDWKATPAGALVATKAKKRRTRVKRKTQDTGGSTLSGDDVQHLGDASHGGGGETLRPDQIQGVMNKNLNKLGRCVSVQPGTRKVDILFGVAGSSGKVTFLQVNRKKGGALWKCVAKKMQAVQFPKFNGGLTRASFSMTVN
jgi:serine/threonine protein kinase